MKHQSRAARRSRIALIAGAVYCAPTVLAAAEFERIAKEDAFVESIVNKRLAYDDGAVIIFLADGTFGGDFSGSRVWGEWVWRDERICHQINIGEKRYKVDCRIPETDGKTIRFRREDGSIYGVAKIRTP